MISFELIQVMFSASILGKEFADFPRAQGSRRVLLYPVTITGSSAFEQKLLLLKEEREKKKKHQNSNLFPPYSLFFLNNVIFNPSLFIVSVLVKLTPLPPSTHPSTDIWIISLPPLSLIFLCIFKRRNNTKKIEVPSPFLFRVQFTPIFLSFFSLYFYKFSNEKKT